MCFPELSVCGDRSASAPGPLAWAEMTSLVPASSQTRPCGVPEACMLMRRCHSAADAAPPSRIDRRPRRAIKTAVCKGARTRASLPRARDLPRTVRALHLGPRASLRLPDSFVPASCFSPAEPVPETRVDSTLRPGLLLLLLPPLGDVILSIWPALPPVIFFLPLLCIWCARRCVLFQYRLLLRLLRPRLLLEPVLRPLSFFFPWLTSLVFLIFVLLPPVLDA